MSQILSFDEARDALAEVIASKNVLLVLGAGASVSSGAPIASGLVQKLLVRYPRALIPPNSSLFDACREIELTPAYGRQDLHEFVGQELGQLKPSDSYKQLPRIRWRGLFTTNYDDLIEKAYQATSRVQTLQPVPEEFRGSFIPRDNHVVLQYLMGSVKFNYVSRSAPVLSWADFHRSIQSRAAVMQLFQNLLADGGKVIYVGYSFGDLVCESVLDEAIEKIGRRNVPYGHAILTDWPNDRRRGFSQISARSVIPVEGTFEEFADLLKDLATGGASAQRSLLEPVSSPAAGTAVTAGSSVLTLTENEAGVYSEAFELLSDASHFVPKLSADDRVALARSVFRGETKSWASYALGLPFKRPAYDVVLAGVLDRVTRATPDDNIILVHGPAGLGKSVMARQLAFELSGRPLNYPVIVAKPTWRTRPDFKLVDRLIEDLEASLPEGRRLPALTIIIDEAELLDRAVPARLARYLKARQRHCAIVLFARTNEYFRHEVPPAVQYVALSDKIDRPEVEALVAHLVNVGIWDKRRIADQAFWQARVVSEWNNSFFDTVYSLVEETRLPLREQVWNEYQQLGETAQQAYLLIAAMYQFGLPIKMEMLMRGLNVAFPTFDAEVIRSDARDVLFTEYLGNELNIAYRGRSKLISQLIFERALPTPGAQLPAFLSIARAVNPSEVFGADELDSLRTLLIQVLGPSGYDSRFAADELSELFKAATDVVEDDVLEHHFGLVERSANRLLAAREHLEKSLRLSTTLPQDLSSLRESPQNIENSLAKVIGLLANEAIRKNDLIEAGRLFDEATEHFVRARSGSFANVAAYDAHARMLLLKADRLFAHGSAQHLDALIAVLDVLSDGIDNVNDEHRTELVALQAEVLANLGQRNEALADLARRAAAADPKEAARYLVAMGRLLVGAVPETTKRKHLHTALPLIVQACENDPTYFSAWKIRAELALVLHPEEVDESVKFLEAALRCSEGTENNWVLYQLAVAYFGQPQYDRSAATFSKLRRVAGSHSRAATLVEVAGARNEGDPFEFDGRVIRGERRNGYFIQCSELSAFGDIYLNPRSERFYTPRIGDRVAFTVGFNYKGIVAVDVKRI